MEKIYDLVIIGSGPAGLAAAIYAQRARLDTLVLEKSYVSGGQVINTYEVDNYPGIAGVSGMDLSMKFHEHAKNLEAEFMTAEVKDIIIEETLKKIQTDKGEILTRTVIIATGARHRKLGVPGEEEFAGMGVSYCATCDGAFFKNKTVAVVGGGDVAVEDAIFLARGSKKVYVLHRREEFRAARSLQEKLFAQDNIEVLWNTVVNEIKGEDSVKSISIENKKDGSKEDLQVDGVFIAVGILPNSELFKGMIDMDQQGYIIAGEDCETSVKGIYAAGDVRTKMLRQIVTAASDGANAVTSAQNYLMFL